MLTRRGVLTGLLAAPVIIKAPGLPMPIKPLKPLKPTYERGVVVPLIEQKPLEQINTWPQTVWVDMWDLSLPDRNVVYIGNMAWSYPKGASITLDQFREMQAERERVGPWQT